jgi:hypothetical protein
VPELARSVLKVIAADLAGVEAQIAAVEAQMLAWHKNKPGHPAAGNDPGGQAGRGDSDRGERAGSVRIPQWTRARRLARPRALLADPAQPDLAARSSSVVARGICVVS